MTGFRSIGRMAGLLALALAGCGVDGGVTDLALPPEGVPWLALEYDVSVEVLRSTCLPGALPAIPGDAVAYVTQDGARVGWVQRPTTIDAAQWALSGQMCPDAQAPLGWRLHLSGGRVLRVVDGDESCRVDTVVPPDGALSGSTGCDAVGVDLVPDACGGLTAAVVPVLFDFSTGCYRVDPCQVWLGLTATPRRADPRDPAPVLGCAAAE
ncbi:MAG: hypothetical protein KC621_07950 [Myxococcales bacterium]|nr:hypothetical protein [Myxococcales bacterium]